MIEAEFGLELLILLLDRPALMREADQLLDRRGSRQVDEEVLDARRGAQILFAQEPDFGSQPSIAPVVGGGDTDGREAGRDVVPVDDVPELLEQARVVGGDVVGVARGADVATFGSGRAARVQH